MTSRLAVAVCLASIALPGLSFQVLARETAVSPADPDGITRPAGLTTGTQIAGAPALYLVFEIDASGSIEPVFSRRVRLSTSPQSSSDEELVAAREAAFQTERPRLTVQVEAADGDVVYQDVVELPRWIRGEFRGRPRAGGAVEIEGYRVAAGRRAFVLRLPAPAGARLVVEGLARSTFDLDRLAAAAEELPMARMEAPEGAVAPMAVTGSPGNRVDILLMGDGYSAAEEALFASHVAEFEFYFFAFTPYAEYRNFVNVSSLFVASAESGADHPPYDSSCTGALTCCADLDALLDPLAGTYVDTAFDARFCAFNIHRLLVVNESAIFAAASAAPDWDKIVVGVNDLTYGGSGGPFSVTSIHDDALEIIQHEYGHSFTGLADEYDTPNPGFPACSDIGGPACEPNATDETTPGLIKWSPWIAPTTPIPTPEGSPLYTGEVGLFEGARYQSSGMYRPRDVDCMMQFLGVPFGEVCAQEYVRKLYGGGWGVPLSGIDPIEPGSESPPTGGVIDGTAGATFSVGLLQPDGSPPLAVTWLVDDVAQAPQTGQPPGTFQFTPPGAGTHAVEVQVEDVTPLVHPAMSGTLLQSSRTWTVQVGPAGGPGRVDVLDLSPSTTTPGNLVLTWAASCSAEAVGYAIYEGTIGNYYSHTLKDCVDDGVSLTEEIQPSPGNTYYFVVPLTAGEEGSYGRASAGSERPVGAAVCRPSQVIAVCP